MFTGIHLSYLERVLYIIIWLYEFKYIHSIFALGRGVESTELDTLRCGDFF